MYAIVVESYVHYGNIVPLGNDGIQKLHNKTRYGWKCETEFLRRNTTGTVYIINDFTQEMCNLSAKQLADYVIAHHVDVL